MPTYDFKCSQCDREYELMITHDDPFPKCEDCDITLQKVWTAPAIHFKGGGWGGNHGGF